MFSTAAARRCYRRPIGAAPHGRLMRSSRTAPRFHRQLVTTSSSGGTPKPGITAPAATALPTVAKVAPHEVSQSLLGRLLNPWADVALLCDDAVLSGRIEIYSTTFGVTSALMCSVSAGILMTALPDHSTADEASTSDIVGMEQKSRYQHNAALLVDLGLSRKACNELIIGTVAASVFAGFCGLGASTVCLAWNAVQPPGYAARFAMQQGVLLTSIPFFSAAAVGLNALALCVALDASIGWPVSCIGFFGTAAAGTLVFGATLRGMFKNYQLRRAILSR
eukprot:SAG31_NODE_941_length_10868_cov_9.232241_8_plen_279_part_00